MKKSLIFLAITSIFSTFPLYGITGGTVVDKSDPVSKTVVCIHDGNGDGDNGTGVILSKSQILTAAHVVWNAIRAGNKGYEKIDVKFGLDGNKPDKAIKIKDLTFSPSYQSFISSYEDYQNNGIHDLAIITIDGNIPDGYTPVQLADQDTIKKLVGSKDDDIILLGYGSTLNNTENKRKLSSGNAAIQTKFTFKDALNIHSNEENKDADTYVHSSHGDSGGPAIIKTGNDYILLGVVNGYNSPGSSVGPEENSNDNENIKNNRLMFLYTSVADPDNEKWIKEEMSQQPETSSGEDQKSATI